MQCPARSAGPQRAWRPAGMTQQESAFSARHVHQDPARRRMRRFGATRGFAQPGHGQDHHQLWLPVWPPVSFANDQRRSQYGSELRKQWAQQGSNLRPLACKARTYRRWTWLDVAWCGVCQPRLWLDVAWRGLIPVDVGSPTSLAPLTFSKLDYSKMPRLRPCSQRHCERVGIPTISDEAAPRSVCRNWPSISRSR
jgi:hypothetical protein